MNDDRPTKNSETTTTTTTIKERRLNSLVVSCGADEEVEAREVVPREVAGQGEEIVGEVDGQGGRRIHGGPGLVGGDRGLGRDGEVDDAVAVGRLGEGSRRDDEDDVCRTGDEAGDGELQVRRVGEGERRSGVGEVLDDVRQGLVQVDVGALGNQQDVVTNGVESSPRNARGGPVPKSTGFFYRRIK